MGTVRRLLAGSRATTRMADGCDPALRADPTPNRMRGAGRPSSTARDGRYHVLAGRGWAGKNVVFSHYKTISIHTNTDGFIEILC